MSTVKELLEQFHQIASSPKAQLDSYLAQGKQVITCVPVYTPEEIIHSMGMVPFGAWGADTEVKEAKRYFPAFICSIMQSVLELGIRGAYQGVSAIVVPSLCDSLKCLGQNWKYAVKDIPFIPMTYPQNRGGEVGMAFTRAGYERVIRDLTEITGQSFSDDQLKKSCEIYNEHNQAMRKLSETLAAHPSITPAQRRDIFKSAYFMLKEEHTRLVCELMEGLEDQQEETQGYVRIITSGILADSDSLLEIMGQNRMQIVFDDVAHESRQYRTDTTVMDSGLDALADKFSRMGLCSLLYDADKKRAAYLVEQAGIYGAKGVVILMTKFCDPEEFDYVVIKQAFEAAGIPLLQVEVDRQMDNYEQAATAIQTFKELLG